MVGLDANEGSVISNHPTKEISSPNGFCLKGADFLRERERERGRA